MLFRPPSVAALGFGVCLLWPDWTPPRSLMAPLIEWTHAQSDEHGLWIVPPSNAPGRESAIARAAAEIPRGDREAAAALAQLLKAANQPLIGPYALLYAGRAQIVLGRHDEAAATARKLRALNPGGYLAEAALWLAVEAAEAARDWKAAIGPLETLRTMKPMDPARASLRLGRAHKELGDRREALAAFRRAYYEYPLTSEAAEAGKEIELLATSPRQSTAEFFDLDLSRAQRLFGAGRYSEAKSAFEFIKPRATGDTRSMVDLRLAQCDFHLRRYVQARNALRAILRDTPESPEANFAYFSTLRGLGEHDEYVSLARAFVQSFRDHPLAQEALNNLGTHYILLNEDRQAAVVFTELYDKYPGGPFGDRAAWKAGWWAYKSGNYAETIRLFESAATTYRRADYRPSWLYWTARAHAQLGARDHAIAGYQRVIESYRNSYYGRQAAQELDGLVTGARPAAGPVSPARRELPPTINGGAVPANADLIRQLMAVGLYGDAILEIRKVQREAGTSPLLDATIAYALRQQGDLRPAINAMRRAYPQFMAEGGEALPKPILQTIFPIDYWDLIVTHASAHRLDPFLMAALIAQESTFQADVRSAANAWGLMQIIPATGRRYAVKLGIRPFSTSRLTNPETNVRIGMTYFADLVRMFGDAAPALAAYNAGEHRVSQWLDERPGIDRDEFIDDIPFPETQNYVKRILGTAEDYRLLYGHLAPAAARR
jgi:soluble lytic murein transglycosylase